MSTDASLPARLDMPRLLRNLGGDQAFIREMLTTYLSVAAASMTTLEEAERANDAMTWMKGAHKLKGASLNITAKRVANLCNEAELIQELPHQQSAAMLFHLHKEIALLQDEIRKVLETDL